MFGPAGGAEPQPGPVAAPADRGAPHRLLCTDSPGDRQRPEVPRLPVEEARQRGRPMPARRCPRGGRSGAGHLALSEEVLGDKALLREFRGDLKKRQKAFTNAQLKQKHNISEVEKAFETEMNQVRLCFAEMTQLLKGKVQSVAEKLGEKKQDILRKMEVRLEEIQENLTRVGAEIAKTEKQLEEKDTFRFLQGFSERRYPEDFRELGDISEDLSLEISKDLLKYRVWKELRDDFRPGSDSLTLNPVTASPWLTLSDDLTSVKDGGGKQELPDDPRRFDPCPCVLGLDGIVSGKHYWEVKVGHKVSWTLGVANESVNRKGDVILSPINGYWTLGLRNGIQYKAFTSLLDDLHLDLKPWVIGVYLDYEGGQVSFYNADGMSHLHTYRDKFTQKLFPFFSPGLSLGGTNTEPLQLLRTTAGDPRPEEERPAPRADLEREDAVIAAGTQGPGEAYLDRTTWQWAWVCFTLLVSLAAASPGKADFTEIYLVCCGMLGFSGLCWSLLDDANLAGISWLYCGVLGYVGLSCFLLTSAGPVGICLVGLSFVGLYLASRDYVVRFWLGLSFGGFIGLLWLLDNDIWVWWICCGVLAHAGTCLALTSYGNVAKVCWWCCGTQGYIGLCLLLVCSSPIVGLLWITLGIAGLYLALMGSVGTLWTMAGLLSYNAAWCVLVGHAELSAFAVGVVTFLWWHWSRFAWVGAADSHRIIESYSMKTGPQALLVHAETTYPPALAPLARISPDPSNSLPSH